MCETSQVAREKREKKYFKHRFVQVKEKAFKSSALQEEDPVSM